MDPEAIIRSYAPFVSRVLRKHGVPDIHVEDSCQEVFLLIFRKLGVFEGRSSLSTWVYGLCRNVARNARRRRLRRREELFGDLPDVALSAGQPVALDLKRAWVRVQAALSTLPEPTRMTFVLFELEGMHMDDVALRLNCNARTAYSRLHLARAHVRLALEQAGFIVSLARGNRA